MNKKAEIIRVRLPPQANTLLSACAWQELRDKLIDHKTYIRKYGEDMPEIRNWKWGQTTATRNKKSRA